MKVKFTRALGSTTQAAAIKSQSGCLLSKQIAMIIPTCHPPTALKHPSIRAALQHTQTQTKRSLLSLPPSLCHVPSLPACRSLLARCTPFTHHDVSTVCRRESKDDEHFDPHQDGNGVPDTQPLLCVGRIKTHNHKTP